MTQAIPSFVFFESVTFIVASLIHFGVLIDGYEHQKAGIAESVIGIVLLVGWVWTWVRTKSTFGSRPHRSGIRFVWDIGRHLHNHRWRRSPYGAEYRLSHRHRDRPCLGSGGCRTGGV